MKRFEFLAIIAILTSGCRQDPAPSASSAQTASGSAGARLNIAVDGRAYHPASVTVPAGRPTTLVFTRTTDEGCGQQLVFPSLNIRRDLPLGQPVEVTITPAAGTLAFTCGMGMYQGTVVAR